ncbi:metallophosphoesterase [Vitiosangium sp. GDMCC 1.1324]|uniref:metallophosphoesterase family protein n=1 Tax=Vitiosangium sp. (strain GDMCC 1.1324) TaxID=2138576 RepID=UPI000D3847BC|nr:metallophosphoesterase [Vitiosangium sp. GDMCC 1.1324]PTL84249.1 hypothetical protein DAT35_12540 [Vitiosangium sp. GDMCC 1.1324]
MSEIETLILRFRDLPPLENGDTVARHSEIAGKEPGYVWWGWWNKGGEQVPFEEFRELLRKARNGGLPLYLLDSGQNQTYRAICTDISWDQAGDPSLTPESDKTPQYYRTRKVLTWFKLSTIEPYELKTSDYSYVRVDKFFTSQSSRYVAFYGKRIFSIQELIEQNRSIWFIRQARTSDKHHEISLLDAQSVSPEHFQRTFIQSDSRNLLWVSDLHYTFPTNKNEKTHHAFAVDRNAPARKRLGEALEAALKDHKIEDLGGMLVSGDITWKAIPEEFEQSLSLFHWAQKWASLTSYHFSICPGNHDLAFTQRTEAKDAPIERTFDMAKEAYAAFYARLFNLRPNSHLSSGHRYLLGASHPVEIVCLNSSWLEQRKGFFQGHGFVGDEQLREAAESFGWNKKGDDEGRPYRIVMLHHHLVPVTYRAQPAPSAAYSVILDAEALMEWVVQYRVDLVLHGHMHQPSYIKLSKPTQLKGRLTGLHEFHVLGMGSTGVVREDVGAVGKNTFGVLRFGASGVTVTFYSISDTDPSEEIWSVLLPYPQTRGT